MTEPGVLGSIFPVRGGHGALFAGNLLRDVSSVLPRSIKQAGLAVVEPGKPHEIQSGIIGHAALLYGKPIAIEDGQFDQREIELVAGRPNNVGDRFPACLTTNWRPFHDNAVVLGRRDQR